MLFIGIYQWRSLRNIDSLVKDVCHAEETVFDRINCYDLEADRTGHVGGKVDSTSGYFRADILLLEKAIFAYRQLSSKVSKTAQDGRYTVGQGETCIPTRFGV